MKITKTELKSMIKSIIEESNESEISLEALSKRLNYAEDGVHNNIGSDAEGKHLSLEGGGFEDYIVRVGDDGFNLYIDDDGEYEQVLTGSAGKLQDYLSENMVLRGKLYKPGTGGGDLTRVNEIEGLSKKISELSNILKGFVDTFDSNGYHESETYRYLTYLIQKQFKGEPWFDSLEPKIDPEDWE
jgi:hypothetical protein